MKEEVKLSLLKDNIIRYIEKPEGSSKKNFFFIWLKTLLDLKNK